MSNLKIADNLTLPLDAVTQRFAFLGRIGSGKTYAATKLIELMLDARAQVVALDPVGKCYGLRVPGTGPAFDIPIFGGLHGDVPLEPTGGALIADLIVDRTLSCVIDVSQFATDAEKSRFASAFAERFFFRKKSSPSAVHVFLEECQEFVPQNTARGEELMLHHWTRMAKLGRNFGIGLSLASQRPQEVNKKVLNLTECLFAFQLRGKHERDAVKDWITEKDSDKAILDELPRLAVGDAIVDSPQWLGTTKRVRVFPKRTADVSATPKVGEKPVDERPLTAVDIAKVREAMAATIERAKADDPKTLRAEIAALKKQLAAGPTKTVEKPVADERAIARAVIAAVKPYQDKEVRLQRQLLAATKALRGFVDAFEPVAQTGGAALAVEIPQVSTTPERRPVAASPSRSPAPRRPRTPIEDIKPGQQKILNALAELEVLGVPAATRHQLGMVAGYNLTGGTGAQHIADLVSAGLVELPDKGVVRLTDTGRASADTGGVPTTLDELHERVLSKLPDGQRRIAEHLITIYPSAISRAELGAAVNYNLTGGTGAQHVADLVTVGAARIPGAGKIAASDLLFPEGLR